MRSSAATIEVFYSSKRVASHLRSFVRHKYSTDPAHMPESHRRYAQWTPSRIVNWAAATGPSTAKLIEEILASRPHPEQGFRSALGIIRLADRYGRERLEAACGRALHLRAYSYRSVQSILAHGLDKQPLPDEHPARAHPRQHNVRGSDLLPMKGRTDLLTNNTIEGLHALRLNAMATGVIEQREQPTTPSWPSRTASACSSTKSSWPGATGDSRAC